MIKIVTIIGARPQIIKAAALSRAIKNNFSKQIEEILVHTGQHYGKNMSDIFFSEMGIPEPKYNLNVGSFSHGKQTALMLEGIESILKAENPDYLIVYGDTNSTVAGSLAASKVHIPVVHIEAGLRSFNKSMPEELNRIMTDHASTLLFTPTVTGLENLAKEGFQTENLPPYHIDNPKIYHCGDIMLDNSIYFSEIANQKSKVLEQYNLKENQFILCTVHRDSNTDVAQRLTAIFNALQTISLNYHETIFIPLHPRTLKKLPEMLPQSLLNDMKINKNIIWTEPVSFFDMIKLEKSSKMIITDSGGVQKEAFFFNKPSLILRPETEWIEIVDAGCAKIVDADDQKIIENYALYATNKKLDFPEIFGNGKASEYILTKIIEHAGN